MTRLNRVIKAFNDYDNLVKELIKVDDKTEETELNRLRFEVSLLIGELKRHGCRREN